MKHMIKKLLTYNFWPYSFSGERREAYSLLNSKNGTPKEKEKKNDNVLEHGERRSGKKNEKKRMAFRFDIVK